MPRVKQFNEAEILEKAIHLFWKQGYHATSIQNLVDHLGINRASLYHTFGGKNKLYEMALKTYRTKRLHYIQQRLAQFPSVKTGIHTLFKEAIQESLDDKERKGCFIVNCTTEYLPKNQHILNDLLENKANFQNIMITVLKRGQEQGELAENLLIKDVAAYLYTLFGGLKVMAKVQPNETELKKTIELGLRVLN